ncbi:MAG: HD-GYP domain-containing protein [Pseudomonadales bacterium]
MSDKELTHLLTQYQITPHEDLAFLFDIAKAVEQRTDKWRDRTRQSLNLALAMNQSADQLADPQQLTAAVLAHDIAMGFQPLKVLNKASRLSAKERKTMQTHIKTAADLIHRMGGWQAAKQMIQSHHERADGKGYPQGRSEEEVCHGAKILAIVDAFTAQGLKNVMHGVMEIHRHTGTQFSEFWVHHFDRAIKSIYPR